MRGSAPALAGERRARPCEAGRCLAGEVQGESGGVIAFSRLVAGDQAAEPAGVGARGGDDEEGGEGEGDDLHDEMYDMAVRVVTESRQASISWLQRKLRVGYNRAARMIERMEREGVVSQAEGARPREVLAHRLDE